MTEKTDPFFAMFGRHFDDPETVKPVRQSITSHLKLAGQQMWIVDLIMMAGFAESKSEARRAIRQCGVKFNEQVVEDEMMLPDLSDGDILRVGKRWIALIEKETAK